MSSPPPYEDLLDYVLIDADRLQKRIAELGKEISEDYRHFEDIVLIGILKGSMLFMTDLMRQLTVPHSVDFMDVTSYGVGVRHSTGDVRILMDLHAPIERRNVLIVEDIVDSGRTLEHVLRLLWARRPASLRVCTLLDKAERREVAVPLDYIGFQIPNVFVFGYGLDIDEYYRNLPFIGVVKPGVVILDEEEGKDDS
ncbi:MAG TPA: hypoxanthine phosphoribosyltransferase [Chloroflexi bacterium]|nr:hypoxanthine phosphoribosyltransferase [Chloroflexota bacterium]